MLLPSPGGLGVAWGSPPPPPPPPPPGMAVLAALPPAAKARMACVLLASVAAAAQAKTTVGPEASCIDLGFTGLNVCSDCETLKEVVKDEGAPHASLPSPLLVLR